MRSLNELPLGSTAKIMQIRGENTAAQRLMALGILPGTEIEMAGVAPWGDPITIRIRGRAVSLRRAEASLIEVGDSVS